MEVTNLYLLSLLSMMGDHFNGESETMICAALYGDLDTLTDILSDPLVKLGDEKLIIIAAICGHLDIVKLLLSDARIDPSEDKNRAINSAAECGHTDIVRLLLSNPRVGLSEAIDSVTKLAMKYFPVELLQIIDAYRSNETRNLAKGERDLLYLVRLFVSDTRISSSAVINSAIQAAAGNNQLTVLKSLLSDSRADLSYHKNMQSIMLPRMVTWK